MVKGVDHSNTSDASVAAHHNVGNNSGIYGTLNDAYARTLSRNEKALASPPTNANNIGSFVGAKIDGLPDTERHYKLDNFYNKVVDNMNTMTGKYNTEHYTPIPIFIQKISDGTKWMHPQVGREVLILLSVFRR